MDHLYRHHRIAITLRDGVHTARITHVRGKVVPGRPVASAAEGEAVCLGRAKELVDRYLRFLDAPNEAGDS